MEKKLDMLSSYAGELGVRISDSALIGGAPLELVSMIKDIVAKVKDYGLKNFDASVYEKTLNDDLRRMLKMIYYTSVNSSLMADDFDIFKNPAFVALSRHSDNLSKLFAPKNIIPIREFSREDVEKYLNGSTSENYDVDFLDQIHMSIIVNMRQKFEGNEFMSNILNVLYNVVENFINLHNGLNKINVDGITGGGGSMEYLTYSLIIPLFVLITSILGVKLARAYMDAGRELLGLDSADPIVDEMITVLGYVLSFVVSAFGIGIISLAVVKLWVQLSLDGPRSAVNVDFLNAMKRMSLISEGEYNDLKSGKRKQNVHSIHVPRIPVSSDESKSNLNQGSLVQVKSELIKFLGLKNYTDDTSSFFKEEGDNFKSRVFLRAFQTLFNLVKKYGNMFGEKSKESMLSEFKSINEKLMNAYYDHNVLTHKNAYKYFNLTVEQIPSIETNDGKQKLHNKIEEIDSNASRNKSPQEKLYIENLKKYTRDQYYADLRFDQRSKSMVIVLYSENDIRPSHSKFLIKLYEDYIKGDRQFNSNDDFKEQYVLVVPNKNGDYLFSGKEMLEQLAKGSSRDIFGAKLPTKYIDMLRFDGLEYMTSGGKNKDYYDGLTKEAVLNRQIDCYLENFTKINHLPDEEVLTFIDETLNNAMEYHHDIDQEDGLDDKKGNKCIHKSIFTLSNNLTNIRNQTNELTKKINWYPKQDMITKLSDDELVNIYYMVVNTIILLWNGDNFKKVEYYLNLPVLASLIYWIINEQVISDHRIVGRVLFLDMNKWNNIKRLYKLDSSTKVICDYYYLYLCNEDARYLIHIDKTLYNYATAIQQYFHPANIYTGYNNIQYNDKYVKLFHTLFDFKKYPFYIPVGDNIDLNSGFPSLIMLYYNESYYNSLDEHLDQVLVSYILEKKFVDLHSSWWRTVYKPDEDFKQFYINALVHWLTKIHDVGEVKNDDSSDWANWTSHEYPNIIGLYKNAAALETSVSDYLIKRARKDDRPAAQPAAQPAAAQPAGKGNRPAAKQPHILSDKAREFIPLPQRGTLIGGLVPSKYTSTIITTVLIITLILILTLLIKQIAKKKSSNPTTSHNNLICNNPYRIPIR